MSQEVSLGTPFNRWKYDVFLTCEGRNTCEDFVDDLCAALIREGIHVFKDCNRLDNGKPISLELEAIEVSRISIIVCSRNYASSSWSLDKLVQIVERMNRGRQMVIPIFYDVDPSTVRNQSENFQEVFLKHEETFRENIEKVQKWRTALIEVANLSGWNLNLTDRHPSEFIQEIVEDILKKLSHNIFWNFGELVGIQSCLEKFRKIIGAKSRDVRMIGFYGIGGIGKTTITRIVYDSIKHEFEGNSFLANVAEISNKDGLVYLQKQLLSQILLERDINIKDLDDGINEIRKRLRHKKILVVIDDVVDIEQLNKLVGNHDWFGVGSKIIITARDIHLLINHGVDVLRQIGGLNYYEALQLFSLLAFRKRIPPEAYLEISKGVVEYVGGVSLFLKVFGLFLFGKTIDEWKSVLDSLKRDPEKRILNELKVRFDRPKEIEKNIVERELTKVLRQHKRLQEEANMRHMVIKRILGYGFLPLFFLALEAISVVLDLCGKSKWDFLLVAFLLSAMGFIITICASLKKGTAADSRLEAEGQLWLVEVVFSVVQLITTLIQFILAVLRVKNNFSTSLLPLAFAIITVVFAFKDKKVVTQDEISNIQESA